MDHLMPGMDGFQAIQAIKSNPDTATIPVVMYTSQEGELYVSQARALGAVGVLPKTVKHSDVSRVLYQLRLLPERREGRAAVATVAHQEGSAAVQIEPARPSGGRCREHDSQCRRAVAQGAKRGDAALRAGQSRSFRAAHRPRGPASDGARARPRPPPRPSSRTPAEMQTQTIVVRQNRWPLVAGVAAIALIPTLVLALFYTEGTGDDQGAARRGHDVADDHRRPAGAADDAAEEHRVGPDAAAAAVQKPNNVTVRNRSLW